ncbi:hypothetical protein ACF0H5_010784 [Mactra antiquata]
MTVLSSILLLVLSSYGSEALDNGLALTPPMGWLTWQRFRCNTDCKKDPDNCISENLIKRQADCMVSEGYLGVGYEYITIDDCWLAKERDNNSRLQPDPDRFPSGIKHLAQYVHSKGLKFGIYEDFGSKTCAGFPGSEYYMQTDAQTFADWEIDLLKFDGCNSDIKDAKYGYPAMAKYLNKTGRDILYSCEWPFYNWRDNVKSNFTEVRSTCNMWRVFSDIQDSWTSLTSVIEYFVKNNHQFQPFSGPGGWNDPDMLLLGNFGLSYDQERVQMAMWSMFASPLIMSVDLCNMRQLSKALLQNKYLIAINQDKAGVQGKLKVVKGTVYDIQIWTRPILPQGCYAVAILNLKSGGGPKMVETTFKELDMNYTTKYNITETFDNEYIGTFGLDEKLIFWVNPSGVYMFTAIPATSDDDDSLKFKPWRK